MLKYSTLLLPSAFILIRGKQVYLTACNIHTVLQNKSFLLFFVSSRTRKKVTYLQQMSRFCIFLFLQNQKKVTFLLMRLIHGVHTSCMKLFFVVQKSVIAAAFQHNVQLKVGFHCFFLILWCYIQISTSIHMVIKDISSIYIFLYI